MYNVIIFWERGVGGHSILGILLNDLKLPKEKGIENAHPEVWQWKDIYGTQFAFDLCVLSEGEIQCIANDFFLSGG